MLNYSEQNAKENNEWDEIICLPIINVRENLSTISSEIVENELDFVCEKQLCKHLCEIDLQIDPVALKV